MEEYRIVDIYNEYLKMQQLRFIVDETASMLIKKDLSDNQIKDLLRKTREKVLKLFPDKKETYNRIYSSRFTRLIKDFQNRKE